MWRTYPRRRELLVAAGLGLTGMATMSGSVVADADPRPDPKAGTAPNEHVRYTQVDPLPCDWPGQNAVAPTGDWIAHHAGWAGFPTRQDVVDFVDSTRQTLTIDGDEFVLEEAGDWEIELDPSGWVAVFWYVTPPKRPQTYPFSWDAVFDDDGAVVNPLYPFDQAIHIVRGRDADEDCL